MIRVSKPSMGPDCHWSSPLPCGTPSTTSTMTTMRARFFSASRWAAVAPTFPAPTTATLASIQALSRLQVLIDVQRFHLPQFSVPMMNWNICVSPPLLPRVRLLDDRKARCFSAGAFLPRLSNGFVQYDAHRIRQVQAPDRTAHGNGKAPLRVLLENSKRHALRFASEYEAAIRSIRSVQVVQRCPCGEVKAPASIHGIPKGEPIRVDPQVQTVPIIEPSTTHIRIVDRKAERLDEVERRIGRNAKAGDITGVRWNLGLNERDVECHHPPRVCISRRGSARSDSSW